MLIFCGVSRTVRPLSTAFRSIQHVELMADIVYERDHSAQQISVREEKQSDLALFFTFPSTTKRPMADNVSVVKLLSDIFSI